MALNYLLDPTFEMVNTAGKPATGGKINVFIHGTRDKYYCASDFNGTLLPFDISLDSLGSAVILADDSQAYDIYIYNRYGTLMMSRYNVQPKSGGGVSVQSITSTDGSITVTNTAGGVDLSVNGATPSVLRASGDTLTSDGSFTCVPLQQSGSGVIVDQNGKVKVEHGWYHYDIVTHFDYSGTPTNQTAVIVLKHGGLESRKEVDLSYPNEGTVALSAEFCNSASGLEEFDISVSGIPVGMSIELAELGIHSIHGQGSGSGEKNIHRLLRWYTTASEADERHPVGDWLHDLDATDPSDPSGHPMVTADQLFDWYEDGQVFELYEVDVEDGQLGWSAVYRMVTWQDQSEWWSQSAEVPGKAVRIEFFRMGMYSTPYRGGLVAYIRYQDEEYMRLYEIMPGESIWIAEYQEKLPYYDRSWHAGDFLRVKQDGSDLEWAPLSEVASSGSYDDLIDKPDLSGYATDAELSDGLATKQDTLTAGSNITIQNNVISATAAPQVNADWDATSGVAEILHKPDLSIYAEKSELATVATSGAYDDLLDKPSIPPAQVNADWTSSSGVSEILHKPAEKDLVAGSNITITESNDTVTISAAASEQVNSDWDATSGVAEILHKPDLSIYAESSDLATVATSGSYTDLLDKPSIPSAQVNADWDATSGVSEILNKPNLATVATTGDYSDLQNLPSIPAAQVNSDWTATSGISEILNKPTVKQVVAGDNIVITEGSTTVTIAASVSSYSAGSGIDITSGVISADTTVLATKSELPVIGKVTV
jgi:signal recognition particle receptor subunit beta